MTYTTTVFFCCAAFFSIYIMMYLMSCTVAMTAAPKASEPTWYRHTFRTDFDTTPLLIGASPSWLAGLKNQKAQAPAITHWPVAMRNSLFQRNTKKACQEAKVQSEAWGRTAPALRFDK